MAINVKMWPAVLKLSDHSLSLEEVLPYYGENNVPPTMYVLMSSDTSTPSMILSLD